MTESNPFLICDTMSTENVDDPPKIDGVDVDCSAKGNGRNSGITFDYGLETAVSDPDLSPSTRASATHTPDPLNNQGNTKESLIQVDCTESATNFSPTLVSDLVIDVTESLLCFEESVPEPEIVNDSELVEKDASFIKTEHTAGENTVNSEVNCTSPPVEDTKESDHLESLSSPSSDVPKAELDTTLSKNLATSTASLNDQDLISKNIICKSPYSRSAENISVTDESQHPNSSTKELNTDTILSQFASQKNKVAATHKIPDITGQTHNKTDAISNIDARYARLPKELLSQEHLGSIVKNVHGIFSSVSGSLKSAYNHRAIVPKPPVKHVMKPVPNGRVMDEIFEDQVIETPKVTTTTAETINTGSPDVVNEIKTKNTEIKTSSDGDIAETDSDPKYDVLKLQIESLERVLFEQRKENASLRERVKQQVDEMQAKDQTFRDLEVKLDLMGKRVEQAEREKDAAVMRYASVECAAIEARRAAEKAAAAERAALTEVELMGGKLKSAHSEKHRICQLYDDKCHELATSERELAKVREDMRELEGRLKWTQSKLRMEMDAYKETAERAEKLSQQVTELEAAKETAIANASDVARAKQLESELKECRAALILSRHEKEDLERRLSSITSQLECCKRERDSNSAELATATAEVERLKECNLRLEEEAAELAALRAQAALADTLSAQLQRESERASQAETALAAERARAETCARREAAALEHAAKLTAHHVARRNQDNEYENKAQALSLDNAALRERITELEADCDKLREALGEETERRNKENRVLARKVAELTEEVADVNKRLEWEKGENGVLRKKHASAIKELNRELQRALKRCEQLEAKLPPPETNSARTGSISSLSSGESAPNEERLQNGHSEGLPDIQIREPDRQALIERIVSLQRAAARRAERCEFLEEHSKQLTDELRQKCKLLRHLLCSMPAGAVASQQSDVHKKEIARLGGGAMAAVWGGDPHGMTLELSLEMNKRLQAVLEDALLKNITLKENMDTLGEEIARLKEQKKSDANK